MLLDSLSAHPSYVNRRYFAFRTDLCACSRHLQYGSARISLQKRRDAMCRPTARPVSAATFSKNSPLHFSEFRALPEVIACFIRLPHVHRSGSDPRLSRVPPAKSTYRPARVSKESDESLQRPRHIWLRAVHKPWVSLPVGSYEKAAFEPWDLLRTRQLMKTRASRCPVIRISVDFEPSAAVS